ncbi:TPA: hypothetical protein N0F65_004195 [Lagenidium giganteum]|uniref:Uncharacterized protein n=1 Tax=Lagenidium giganteum TaxID=4803 RepID=A0AAV2YJR7_9STRA|nr:TPA: hypothetical protein N0F65_004195 [Lagenidium giganteum]
MPKKTAKKRAAQKPAQDEANDLAGLEALVLDDAADESEHQHADAMRTCVIAGDAPQFLELLAEQQIDAVSSPLVYLMEWFHLWQQEYEAFVHVLEQEEADAGICAARRESAHSAQTADSIVSDSDVVEMEAEAQQVLQGFGKIALDLLTELKIEKPDTVLDKYGWTLLMQASNSGLRDLMEALLAYPDVDVNSTGKSEGNLNPLYLAIQSDHTSEAMLLLKNGAIASATQVVQTLRPTLGQENDEDVAPADDGEGNTEEEEDCALFQACRMANLIVVEEMIALGVNLNASLPSSGDRALHVAVMFEAQEVVELLLANDSLEVNAQNASGQTCLFGCSSVDIVRLLVEKGGVDPTIKDIDAETAYSIADALGDEEVAAFLRPLCS